MNDLAEAPATIQGGAGALLRREREAAGLHVAALAVALKVPVRKLEALEADRYEDVGDVVFIRALAASVCRTLKIDPQPVLERLPQTATPRLVNDTERINAPFRSPRDSAPPSWLARLRQPVPLTVMALLVGAVVIALVPMRRHEEVATPAAASSASAPQSAPAASEPAGPVAVAATTPVSALAAAPVADKAAEPASATNATPTAAADSGILVFRTKGQSWVEVVDAKGAIALRKLMAAGESAGASGVLPLQVTIGKVDMTEMQLRGKPFDLKSVSHDNVARFQVK